MTIQLYKCATRQEQLAKRRELGRIGGSDAAGAAGMSRWATRLETYLRLTDPTYEFPDNPNMYRGRLLEPVVRQMYADATGQTVESVPGLLTNTDFPFAMASLDGIASSGRVLECKTAKKRGRRDWGPEGTAEVPIEYLLQVAHYMMVADLPGADVAVLFGDFELSIYIVERDAELESLLATAEAVFWERVEKRLPPEPEGTRDAVRRWPRAVAGATVKADEADLALTADLARLKALSDEIERRSENVKNALKARIGEAESLVYDDEVIASWTNVSPRSTFDVKAFKESHPRLYKRFLKPVKASRRFLLKEKAECLKVTDRKTEAMIPENLPAMLTQEGG